MKTKRVLLLMVLCAILSFRSFAQTYIGRQLVDQYPVTAWNTMTYGLTWLPTDYSTNTAQKYPLLIFLHGSGEGGDGVSGLWNLISTGLPQRISNGWNPEAVNPVDGQNYKFIVVSPQAPSAAHWSYGFAQLPYILNDVMTRYRVDPSRVYVTGLSAGGAGTWACVTNTPEFAQKFAAILPVSAAGTNTSAEGANIPLVGGTYGVKVWSVDGALDAWLAFAQQATASVNNATPAPTVPAIVSAVPGVGHEPGAWNTPYDPSWRNNSQGMNCFEWLLQWKRTTGATSTAPTANAGGAQVVTLPTSQVTLNGSGTAGTGNSIVSYAWTKMSGPASGTIATPNTASTLITGLTQGNYVYRLTVTDNLNATATSDVNVTVNAAPNVLPVANAGPDQNITLPANAVVLSGSATDADGTIASYQWTKIAGPAALNLTNATSAQANAGGLTQGTYQFELKVTDNSGGVAKDTVNVVVNPAPNVPPTANAGADQSITLPVNTVTLNGSGTDADGTISAYQWTRISGPASAGIVSPTQAQTVVNSLVQGTYRFELKVTDNNGAIAKDTVQVTVNHALNVPPVAHAGGSQAITLPLNSVSLNGSGTDADGSVTAYQWNKIAGPAAYTIASATQAQTTVSGLVQGVYQFELKVTDDSSAVSKDTLTITVNHALNSAPLAQAGSDIDITLPVDSAQLQGYGSDTDGVIASYNWTKISGPASYNIVNAASAQTTVNGLVAGTYQFQLAVTDDSSAVAKDTVVITVHPVIPPPNSAPVANAGADAAITLPLDSTLLTGSGVDADNNIATYSWTKISGPAAYHINNAAQASTIVSGLIMGTYGFELTVTDSAGASAKDTVYITVNHALNMSPVASAGTAQTITLPVDSVLLQGSAADADGTIASYHWTMISGPAAASIANATQAQTWVHGLQAGTYTFELIATDDSSATARDTVTITVNAAPNVPPTANAGRDTTITLPVNTVVLDGSAADADGSITNVRWTKISGPAQDSIVHADSLQTALVNLVEGIYQYKLSITDNSGDSTSDTVTVTVLPAPVVHCNGVKRYMVPAGDGGRYISADPSASGWYLQVNPGDTLVLRAQYPWSYLSMVGYNGTSSCPIVITNEGGQAWLTAGIDLKDCHHIKISGGGDANTYYGFRIYNPEPDGNGVALSVQGKSGNIEMERVDVYRKTYGVWAKQDPLCDQSYNYPNYVMDSIEIHHCRFKNIGQDCIYAGNTDPTGQRDIWCNGVLQHFIPMRISNINIHHLIIDSVMRTGIQVSGADRGYNQVHDNIITRCGYEYNQQQGTGISIGGMTKNCHVFNNYIRYTFLYGILSFGAGVNYIEHNDVDSSGWLDGVPNMIAIPANIMASTKPTVPFDSSTIIVRYNKLGIGATATQNNIDIRDWSPNTWTVNNVVCNNTRLDGTTPATLFISPTIRYINDCSAALPNMPPSADAGMNISLALTEDSTMLHGAGSDPDGTIIAYHWSQVNGPSAAVIASRDSAQTSITGLIQGVYTFRLTVSDDDSATATDDVQVIIAPPNVAPIANAGGNQSVTLPPNTVTMNGSGVDPDGTIVSYIWKKISGPAAYNIVNPNDPHTQVTGLTQGVYQFELTVIDDHGVPARDTMTVTVNPAPPPSNVAPAADAGAPQTITLPTNFVTLNGSGTDADGTIVSYQWTKTSGPASYHIENANSAQTLISNLTEGVYQFQLTVTDNSGATASSWAQITVNPAPNVLPVADAGADQVITLPTNATTLNGSGSDADGTITGLQWTQISGPSASSIASASQPQTAVSGLQQGVYQFELMVLDNSGAVARDTMTITVNPAPNVPPTAYAGPDQSLTLPVNTTTLNGNGTDADGSIVSYHWSQIAGPAAATIGAASQAQTAVAGLIAGVYQFELTVADNSGATAKDTLSITVSAAVNVPPVANAGPDQTITLPVSTVSLSGSGTDADGTIMSYQWVQLSGPSTAAIASATQAQTSVNSLTAGVYQFELTVVDNNGAIAKDTMIVTVNPAPPPPPNVPPVADAGLDQVITLPVSSVALNGSGTDADGNIVSYRWTKISGPVWYSIVNNTAAQTTVQSLIQGTYQFELTVTDNNGATAKDTMRVVVNAAIPPPPPVAPNIPPVANAGADQTITLPDNSITITGSGTDVDGTIASYNWTKISGPSQYSIADAGQAQTALTNLVQGTYQFELRVTDNNGAVARDTMTVTVQPDPRIYSSASLYPNPATSVINVRIDALTSKNQTEIRIYDVRGVLVYNEQFLRTQQVMVKQIDVTSLQAGSYLVVVNADINKNVALKFVKQ